MNRREWTEEEIQYLIKHYGKMPAKVIGEKLGRTESSIIHKARRLGVKSSSRLRNLDQTQPSTLQISEDMAAYLAGLLDGDGSVTLRRQGHHNTYSPEITITSKDRNFLEEIRRRINGGKIRRITDKRRPSPIYHLYFEKIRDCLTLASKLKKYAILKKRHLELLEEYCKIRLTRPVWERLKFSDREREIYEEIKKLNYRSKKRKYQPMEV